MPNRWRSFLALPRRERALTMEAAAWLMLASPVLRLLPFRHVARWLGDMDGEKGGTADPALPRAIGRSVDRAARHLPWRPLCLPRALAARAMLRRRGVVSTVHFGVRLEEEDRAMQAHAWVTTGATGVIGVPAAGEFKVLASYSR